MCRSKWKYQIFRLSLSKVHNKSTECRSEKQLFEWYFVTKIVLTYREKNCSSDWEKILKFEAESREFAKIWDHMNNLFKQWKVRTILVTECFFKLFLVVSQIYKNRTIIIQIGKNHCNLEICRKRQLEKSFSWVLNFFDYFLTFFVQDHLVTMFCSFCYVFVK